MPKLLQGSIMALMASAAYGLGLVVMRLALRDGRDPVVGSAISMLTATVLLAVVVRSRAFSLDGVEKRALPSLVASGVCSALGVVLLYAALRSIPAVLAAPIHGTWPVMAVMLSAVFLKRLERISVPLVAGTLLVVAGLALVAVG